jgi:hypothetical protein
MDEPKPVSKIGVRSFVYFFCEDRSNEEMSLLC